MQHTRHFYFYFLLLLLCSASVYSQDIPAKGEVNIPAKEKEEQIELKDTISQNIKDLVKPEIDSVGTDTVKPKKEALLTDLVDYYGEDYVYIDKRGGKIYMYNKAYIIYGEYKINAGLIILDYNKNEVYAKGIDSAGVYSQAPVFEQAANKVEPDSIRFNFDSKKAIIYNSVTKQNGINTIAEITKKENDSVYFLRNVKFTTSENIEDPEYYFYTRKAKFVPGKKVVTGLTNMYIADVPTPIGLPFAFFPLAEDRASGFLLPNIGENNNRGFFFQNGGYYFAINDYVDFTIVGDYYTNGSFALRGDSDYSLRYKFNGKLSVRYENLINSERGFPDFSQRTEYNIRWNHNQDAKANPTSQFRASVNLGSSTFFQNSINQSNNASQLVNNLNSSISYSKNFDTKPEISFTAAATHTQSTQTGEVSVSLPNFNGSVGRIFPFEPKSGTKKGILQNINVQYTVDAQNSMVTTAEDFFTSKMFENARAGARHTIPINTNFKLLDYLSVNAGTSYNEVWLNKTISESYDDSLNDDQGGVVRDTITGFDRFNTYSFNTGIGTTLYGVYGFKKGNKIETIRHVINPTLSYSIGPSFDQFYDEYTIPSDDEAIPDEVVQYTRFQSSLYGQPGNTYTSSLSYGITNTIEAKVRDSDTTATELKKINLLNNLSFRGSYNFAADSLNWSAVQFSAGIPVVKKLDLNITGRLNPYALNNNNQDIDVFNIDNGGSLFRLTNANLSFNYSFSSKDFASDKDEDEEESDDFDSDTFRNGGRPDGLFGETREIGARDIDDRDKDRDKKERDWYKYSLPWDLGLSYTITYNNTRRQNEISSQSINFRSSVELSPRWSVRVSSGYDLKNKGITPTQFAFERDLESWRMRFSWAPIGVVNTSWNFYIGIKGNILGDIKYEKRREADRRF